MYPINVSSHGNIGIARFHVQLAYIQQNLFSFSTFVKTDGYQVSGLQSEKEHKIASLSI